MQEQDPVVRRILAEIAESDQKRFEETRAEARDTILVDTDVMEAFAFASQFEPKITDRDEMLERFNTQVVGLLAMIDI